MLNVKYLFIIFVAIRTIKLNNFNRIEMNKELLQTNILKAIQEKVPNKTTLANMLVDLLCIEKEAVYRRLRGEVPFTFAEIALIVNQLGVSLDNVISSSLSSKSKPFQLKIVNYFESTEIDYNMLEEYLHILKEGADDPRSELVDCTNTLPPVLYCGFRSVERFYLFKNIYQSGRTNRIRSFSEVKFTSRSEKYFREIVRETRKIKSSYYILDPLVFQYLVNDVIYYKEINLINDQEVQQLKEEIFRLIQELESVAASGVEKETGNKLYLYVASLNIDMSFWYIDINNYHLSMLKAFVLNNFVSLDDESFHIIKIRINALLRSSTMISVSGERQRKLFFDRQREIINTL